MLSYYLECTEKTDSKNQTVAKINKGRLTILSKFSVCDTKKLRFIKEQEASGLLSSLGIDIPFSKIPLLSPLL